MTELTAPTPSLSRLSDLLGAGYAAAAAAYEARCGGKALGPAIGCSPQLSAELCGSLPVGLTIVHGPPGSGKSALAAQLAAEAGCPSVIATFEMPPLEFLRRHAARATSTFVSKLRNGTLPPTEWLRIVERAIVSAPDLAILDGTCAPVSYDHLAGAVERVRGDSPHALLVVDSASAWVRSSSSTVSEYEATSAAIASLQRLAAELRISILVVAEQNRAGRGDDRQESAAGTRASSTRPRPLSRSSVIATCRRMPPAPSTSSSSSRRIGSAHKVAESRCGSRVRRCDSSRATRRSSRSVASASHGDAAGP